MHVMMDLFRNLSRSGLEKPVPQSPRPVTLLSEKGNFGLAPDDFVCIHAIRTVFQLTFHEKHKIALQLKRVYTRRSDLS